MFGQTGGALAGIAPAREALDLIGGYEEAERLAKLEPQKGSAWHAYRRGGATARKQRCSPS